MNPSFPAMLHAYPIMKATSISRSTVRWIVAGVLASTSVAVVVACRTACGTVRNPDGHHPIHIALKKLRCSAAEARLRRQPPASPQPFSSTGWDGNLVLK